MVWQNRCLFPICLPRYRRSPHADRTQHSLVHPGGFPGRPRLVAGRHPVRHHHRRAALGPGLLHARELRASGHSASDVISRKELTGRDDLGTGTFGTIGNIIWLVFVGWWLALGHLMLAIGLGITIIGIPFAIQHLKLAYASLFPIGQTVVDADIVGGGPAQPRDGASRGASAHLIAPRPAD